MEGSPTQVDDLPASVVETEEPISDGADAPLPDEVGSTAPPAKEASQEKPEGKEPAEKDETNEDDDGNQPEKSDDDKSKSGKDAPRRRNDPQKSIRRLTRQRSDAEREAAYWRGRAEAAEQQRGTAEAPQPDPKPKLEDYDSAEDYAEALADWKLEEKAKEGPPASESQEPGNQPEPRDGTPSRKPTDAEVASFTAAKLKYDDLEDVLFDTSIPWTSHMADAVSDMDNAAEVLYRLGQDDAEVARISKLAPRSQEREVWRFAEKLNAELAESDPAEGGDDEGGEATGQRANEHATDGKKPQVSKAGPVPSRVSGRATSTKSIEDMSEAEYIAHMDQREAERRRRGY